MKDNPLKDHVREHAANRPGVYHMLGAEGEVLYVGKSIRVRGRLLSYFRADKSDKARELIQEARQIAWEYVPNEFAALVREMRLIQRWQPRYNVQHRRRRRYAFVKVTRERAPRLLPVTRVLEDGAIYYGPFPAVGKVAQTVRELAQSLDLRDCPATTPIHFSDQLDLWTPDRTPGCLRADLGTCLAPCCGRTAEGPYGARVNQARAFLDGTAAEPIRRVDEAMRKAASRMDFEYASILRDRGDRLRRFQEELLAFRGRIENLSFVYSVPGFEGADRLYLIRRGTIRAELPAPTNDEERRIVSERVREVFKKGEPGPTGLQANEAAEILLVARWFRLRSDERSQTQPARRWLRDWGGGPARRRLVSSQGGSATSEPPLPRAGELTQFEGIKSEARPSTASTAGRE